jgi:hypothetical protein
VAETDVKAALTADHKPLDDDIAARNYFAKFARITGHLGAVTAMMRDDGLLNDAERALIGDMMQALAETFDALSMKYLIAGRLTGPAQRHLTVDVHDSGFPVFQEIATMVADAAQAAQHLAEMPAAAALKDAMVAEIVGQRRPPTALQYALSQRNYYEKLAEGGLFLPQVHPVAQWIADVGPARRRFLVSWAVYDSQSNIPVIYLMEVEDSGRRPLPKDERWPAVQAHLLAQSPGGLKLLTIAKGFDEDFVDLHPKRLRRIRVGPMHSAAYTMQTGPIRQVLDGARARPEDDWALAWTVEELESERVEMKAGWFSDAEYEVFRLDPLTGADTGATRVTQSLILPQLPFQVLSELDPAGFRAMRKFVVAKDGRVVSYA